MPDDTFNNNPAPRFPATRHSALLALADENPETRIRAREKLISVYWKPVYKYVRLKWNKDREAAEDLTQGFFLEEIEKNFFKNFEKQKARFRTFLRVCLDRFVQKQNQSASRIKRGGDVKFVSLDYDGAENEISRANSPVINNAERFFAEQWAHDLLSSSVTELRTRLANDNKQDYYKVFERYDIQRAESGEKVTYAEIAQALEISVESVTNYLAYARKLFRQIVKDTLREITASDQEYREELKAVLGVDQ